MYKSTVVPASLSANLPMQGDSSPHRVPDFLQEALDNGYISPNLPNPRGFKWKTYSGGRFALALQGG